MNEKYQKYICWFFEVGMNALHSCWLVIDFIVGKQLLYQNS